MRDDFLEPEANSFIQDVAQATDGKGDGCGFTQTASVLSIAISLKRIADAVAPTEGQPNVIGDAVYHALTNALFEDMQRRGGG